ncbi:MAG: type III secretion protein, partial [Desulfamplus sp.]|nr:type III secretion protein [Desulfamplus sp.]
KDLDPIQMLELQFQMGKFNAMVEATSSVTKGLTDTAKTLAQRAGG